MLLQSLASWIIFSFSVVITADCWRDQNSPTITIVEIEPKKGAEKSSDSKNDFKEALKGRSQNHAFSLSSAAFFASLRKNQPKETLPSPYLSLPDLPPELT
jgi:hypothetical protein